MNSETVSFLIPVAPRPKHRHRIGLIGGKPRAIPDRRTARDEAAVAVLASPHAPAEPWSGPVRVAVTSRVPIPVSWPRWEREAAAAGLIYPTSRPDVDNFAKAILDALSVSGRWWLDDAQVIRLVAEKVFAAVPATVVTVEFLSEPRTREEWKARGIPADHDEVETDFVPRGERA